MTESSQVSEFLSWAERAKGIGVHFFGLPFMNTYCTIPTKQQCTLLVATCIQVGNAQVFDGRSQRTSSRDV